MHMPLTVHRAFGFHSYIAMSAILLYRLSARTEGPESQFCNNYTFNNENTGFIITGLFLTNKLGAVHPEFVLRLVSPLSHF